jgi:chaperonin cofactor prefoldin
MYPTYNPQVSLGTNMQTVVDIKTRIDNETKEFVVPSNLSVHTYGDYTLSENKEAMISEVDSLLQDVTTKIDNMDKYKEDAEVYKKILKDLNPVYAKEQERDEAISDLNARMDDLQDVISRLDSFLRRNETSLTK